MSLPITEYVTHILFSSEEEKNEKKNTEEVKRKIMEQFIYMLVKPEYWNAHIKMKEYKDSIVYSICLGNTYEEGENK